MNQTVSAEVEACRKVGEWFLRSGIQESNGGVARYHLSDSQCNAPLSTEITGYASSVLIDLYRESQDTRYLQAARQAASYLVRAWNQSSSAMPFECAGDAARYTYFFDLGIIVRGLLSVWRECGDPEFLETAKLCARSMHDDFSVGPAFAPILELPAKKLVEYVSKRWSRSPGCYQLKAALAWLELHEITQQNHDLAQYNHLLMSSLESQSTFLPGTSQQSQIMDRLHAYAYFLEGLLPCAEDAACRTAIAGGIDQLAGFISQIGSEFLRSDVVAQLLRIRIFAAQYGICALDQDTAATEIAILHTFQIASPDPRYAGGFWFGKREGQFLPFVNPVSASFCYQALKMWDKRGHPDFDWRKLI